MADFNFGQNLITTALELRKLQENRRQFNEDSAFRNRQLGLLDLFRNKQLVVDQQNTGLRSGELENSVRRTDLDYTKFGYEQAQDQISNEFRNREIVRSEQSLGLSGQRLALDKQKFQTEQQTKQVDPSSLNKIIDNIIEPDLKPTKVSPYYDKETKSILTEKPVTPEDLKKYRTNQDTKIRLRTTTGKMNNFLSSRLKKGLSFDDIIDQAKEARDKGQLSDKDINSFETYLENRIKYDEYLK